MQLLAHIADPLGEHLLYEHVNIFTFHVDGKSAAFNVLQDLRQSFDQRIGIVLPDDALGSQHTCVGHRAGNILLVHSAVKADGGIKIIRDLFCCAVGSAGPHLSHGKISL